MSESADRRRELEAELRQVREQLTDHLRTREAELLAQIAALDQALLPDSDDPGRSSSVPSVSSVPLVPSVDEAADAAPCQPQRFESWAEIIAAHQAATEPQQRTDSPHRQPPKSKIASAIAATAADEFPDQPPDAEIQPEPSPPLDETAVETAPPPAAVIEASADDATPRRARRPVAMLISTAVHGVLLLLLAGMTFSLATPKDQISISASSASSEEISIETIAIETVEMTGPPDEPTEPNEPIDLSLDGEMPMIDVSTSLADVLGPPTMTRMLSAASQSDMMKVLQKPTDQTMEFCGVEGGGNHFVYLVDSSQSMGDAFDSAREALLSSINLLTEKQRFYVVFYDSQPDFMRISDPKTDEEWSVTASADNKRRLRAWAMRIGQDRGQNPHEVLQFALKLRPDVIFLLSDGEFPVKVEDLLEQENHVTNLFGETNRISIVHTIGYHSRDGATRMKRIASTNGGQYRYVPKP